MKSVSKRLLVLGVLAASSSIAAFVACGSSTVTNGGATDSGGGGATDSGTNANDGSSAGDAADSSSGCPRVLGAADHARKVLVSHPFTSTGDSATGFELLTLSTAGTLAKTGTTFQMGTASTSPIVFTPDGSIALVAQDDGTVGVVRFDSSGVPSVVHAGFKGHFYAGAVVMDPSGTRAYVLDADTVANGGGVYAVDIGCDGTLTERGIVVPGGTDNAMTFVPDASAAVLAAGGAFDSDASADTHVVDFSGTTPSLVGSAGAFPEGGAIVANVEVTRDGRFALLSDNGIIVGNRIAVVGLGASGPTANSVLNVPNPAAVIASPYDNAAIALSSDGMDAIRVLSYDASAAQPFSIVGLLTYVNGAPQLPSFASQVRRGSLAGTVIVAENLALRVLAFEPDGGVIDVALTSFGTGSESIVGVVGMEP